jgi:hypothetical protein
LSFEFGWDWVRVLQPDRAGDPIRHRIGQSAASKATLLYLNLLKNTQSMPCLWVLTLHSSCKHPSQFLEMLAVRIQEELPGAETPMLSFCFNPADAK